VSKAEVVPKECPWCERPINTRIDRAVRAERRRIVKAIRAKLRTTSPAGINRNGEIVWMITERWLLAALKAARAKPRRGK
jgi:hypothetical protein